MGMSTHVIGFKPADEKWHQMKAIWDNCKAAGISIPDQVEKFFEYETPDDNGVQVELEDVAATEWSNEWAVGYEVDVTKLPKDVTVIRFYNSW